jgi:hypothetical protein
LKLAVNLVGMRSQEHRQPLQMHTKLIAQDVCGVGELRRELCCLHDLP